MYVAILQSKAQMNLTIPRPTVVGSIDVRYLPTTKEDEAHENYQDVVQKVTVTFP